MYVRENLQILYIVVYYARKSITTLAEIGGEWWVFSSRNTNIYKICKFSVHTVSFSQSFATKFGKFSNFKMLFQAAVIDFFILIVGHN